MEKLFSLGSEQGSDGSDGWVAILVRVGPDECSISVSEPKVSME